jgi:hypothetical protein
MLLAACAWCVKRTLLQGNKAYGAQIELFHEAILPIDKNGGVNTLHTTFNVQNWMFDV